MFAGLPAAAQTSVPAATVTATMWQSRITVPAMIGAPESAALAAPSSGTVTQVLFQSGQAVAAGQVLVQLNNAAQSAQLALDDARHSQAMRDLGRTQKLMSIAGASKSALEQAQAAEAEAAAQVKLDQANLALLQITAPFAGIAGIRKIDPGDYLQAGQMVVSLTAAGKLRVFVSIPQSEAANLATGTGFTLTVPVGDGQMISAPGQLTALSPQVDPATNARDVEGRITAGGNDLIAGMAGTLSIATGAPAPAFLVPSTALNDSMLGPYVYLLKPAASGNYTLSTIYVKIDDNEGASTIIAANGLAAGMKIVALGGFNLADGATVTLASP